MDEDLVFELYGKIPPSIEKELVYRTNISYRELSKVVLATVYKNQYDKKSINEEDLINWLELALPNLAERSDALKAELDLVVKEDLRNAIKRTIEELMSTYENGSKKYESPLIVKESGNIQIEDIFYDTDFDKYWSKFRRVNIE
ncbi:MAG: hypothetical protein J7K73_00615 [Nanoarchaeota archaeon]|nr:hypothetical protein [Nanoarchaeota archaeon]